MLVLGAGRSGTSLVARALNLLGVDLGRREGLMAAGPTNPRGFWEQEPLVDLNGRLLAALGGTWDEPPPLEPGWERSPALEPLRREAAALVARLFGGARLWGFKDPRTSVTLPFWRPLLPDPAYVVCVRNPADVAASLLRANLQRDRGEALGWWLRMSADALANSAGAPRLVVAYEDLLADPDRQLGRLARFLGRGAPTPAERAAVAAHLDRALRHHRAGAAGLAGDRSVPAEVVGAYLALLRLARPRAGEGEGEEAALAQAAVVRLWECFRARRASGAWAPDGAIELERLLARTKAELAAAYAAAARLAGEGGG